MYSDWQAWANWQRWDASECSDSSGSTLFATHPPTLRHNIGLYIVLVKILENVWLNSWGVQILMINTLYVNIATTEIKWLFISKSVTIIIFLWNSLINYRLSDCASLTYHASPTGSNSSFYCLWMCLKMLMHVANSVDCKALVYIVSTGLSVPVL